MIEAIGGIVAAIFVAVVSGVLLDWWSGWRGRTWLSGVGRHTLKRIGIGRRRLRLLVFVSAGGTCRDPMAKVIAERLIEERAPDLKNLRIEARGIMDRPTRVGASHAARVAVRDLFGEDLLADYRSATLSARDIEAADLILVMAANLLHKGTLPPTKTYLFKEFFGLTGDVEDPWPDGRDQATLDRYRATAEEIKSILEVGLGRLRQNLGE